MNFTPFNDWLQSTSILVVGGALIFLFTAVLSLGWIFGQKTRPGHTESDPILISAVLGLLALMLSFTYGLAVDRYEARRLLVQEEANAIRTMYLRAQLIEEPERSEIQRILVDYTDNRIALAYARRDDAGALLARSDQLLRDFWFACAAAFPSLRHLDFSSTFYDSVSHLIEVDATRKSAHLARVPPVIFVLLLIYITAAAALLGYFALNKQGLFQSFLFLTLLASFLLVIIDIDQPSMGGINVSQAPMERMRATLPP